MIRIDFDEPSYLRLQQGTCIVSSRLAHMLPEHEHKPTPNVAYKSLEPVIINRLYRKNELQAEQIGNESDEYIKGEFIPCNFAPQLPDASSIIEAPNNGDNENEQLSEVNFQGIAGKSVTGIYGGSGFAHYRFRNKNGNSFFLRIGKHLIWGVELNAQLRQSGAKHGDKISVTFLGKTPVSVLKDVLVDGKVVQDWVDTHRNAWEIKIVK